MSEAKSAHEMWRDNYVAMVRSGVDPVDAADAMLAVGGLIVELRRGTQAAKLALLAGLNRISAKERPTTPPPSAGDALH